MCVLGAAAVLSEPTGGKGGGEEEDGGEHSTAAAAGRGSNWGYPERLAEGDRVGLVCLFSPKSMNRFKFCFRYKTYVLIFLQDPDTQQPITQTNTK